MKRKKDKGQCPMALRFGRWLTVYCQGEIGHKGDHTPPDVSWRELKRLGATEHDETKRRASPAKSEVSNA